MHILDQKQAEELSVAVQKAMAEFDLGEIKATKSNTFKVVASDESVDRDGEIIKINGRDFQNFLKNPVMFIDHKSWTVESIVAKATKVYVEDQKVIVEGVFTDKTEAGKLANDLYQDGFLKTVSVGFFVKARNPENEKIIESAELYEVSFVSVPANPNAVSLDAKSIEKAKELGLVKKDKLEPRYATIEDLENTKNEILEGMKAMLDGKSEKQNVFMQSLGEETLKAIARATANGLREIKISKQ